MSPQTIDTLFKIANAMAMGGWIALIVFPNAKATKFFIRSGALSGLFGLTYTCLFLMSEGFSLSNFQSLGGVQLLFEKPIFLLAGWLHYLAFDLLVGAWITEDAENKSIKRWSIVPSLFLTFMFGPIGFVSYLLLRKLVGK